MRERRGLEYCCWWRLYSSLGLGADGWEGEALLLLLLLVVVEMAMEGGRGVVSKLMLIVDLVMDEVVVETLEMVLPAAGYEAPLLLAMAMDETNLREEQEPEQKVKVEDHRYGHWWIARLV